MRRRGLLMAFGGLVAGTTFYDATGLSDRSPDANADGGRSRTTSDPVETTVRVTPTPAERPTTTTPPTATERSATSRPTTDRDPTATPRPTATVAPDGPAFELRSFSVADGAEFATPLSYEFVVANAGETTGTFETDVSRTHEGREWTPAGTARATVDPGYVRSFSGEVVPSALGEFGLRLDAFGVAETVAVGPRVRSLGTGVTTPEGVAVVPFELSLVDEYEDRYGRTRTPPGGGRWAFLSVRAANVADGARFLPGDHEFALTVDGTPADRSPAPYRDGRYVASEVAPGESHEGWIPFAVPGGTTPADATVEWRSRTDDGRERVARWTVG